MKGLRVRLTVIDIVVLALGLGLGTAAVFSVVDAVLLRPVGFEDIGRLMMIWAPSGDGWQPVSPPALEPMSVR
jgi:hypothetical protein